MRISSVKLRNLRSIEELQVDLPEGLTTVVGSNSSGKSNLFRAFELFFAGTIDRRGFNAALDMPAWIIGGVAPSARTSIQVEFDLSGQVARSTWASVAAFFAQKGWNVPVDQKFTLIRYFSRSGATGFQCAIPGRGTRESESEQLREVAEKLLRRVEYRYVPSLKDLQSESFQQIGEELKRRLLSIWAGGRRQDIADKKQRFQTIRQEIEQLIQDSAEGLSESLNAHFPEVSAIKLAMASTELEDMIGSLDIFADDGHETLMRQKGSGVQGASIIHMLRILRETAPRGGNNKQLFLWNIEEPETFLHPSAQRKLATLLQRQAANTQILLTTHSPIFVQRAKPLCNLLFRRENRGGHHCTIRARLPAEDPLRPVRESLGTSLSDSLALHEAVILVEGVSDVTVFQEAYRRLCRRHVLPLAEDYVAFVSGHGASQQATAFSILRAWSPLSRLVAIFDYDQAGREEGARRIRTPGAGIERKDYFYLPHAADDVTLEDMYSRPIIEAAQHDGAVVQYTVIKERPDGTELSRETEWNKEPLARYFCDHADDAQWQLIEDFIKDVVQTAIVTN